MNGPPGTPIAARPTVQLTEAEFLIAQWIAKQRQARNNAAGLVDAKYNGAQPNDPQRGIEIHVMGFASEMAFCKMFNVYPDFCTDPRHGSADCYRFGETIDVKATKARPGGREPLRVRMRKIEGPADLYALIVVDCPIVKSSVYRFAGFARAADLLVEERLTPLANGGPPMYVMAQHELAARQLLLPWSGDQ